jgi:ABC-type phosphate transport system ATPase subunit
MDLVEQAARLGGAEFIWELPHKFDTFVSRPAHDYIVEGYSTSSIFVGKNVDYSKLKLNDDQRDLSGGQKQRVAL